MRRTRHTLALLLAVIAIMSVMAVSAFASTANSEDSRRVTGSAYTYSAARDKENSTAVYLKITSSADDHLFVRVYGCDANGNIKYNSTMAGANVDNVVCRKNVDYSVHNSVYEDNCCMAKLGFRRLDPAASYITVGYKWSPDSSKTYNHAT